MTSTAPMLHIPTKKTSQVDFTGPFNEYIATHYQESPQSYAQEVAMFNKIRQDTLGAGKDITGRDILYRYYGQLEYIDSRFPIQEAHVKVLFTWYDAFTSEETCQHSIAYEKACTLFNTAATLTSIAALQNRFEPTGQKTAYNYFQAAAGLFQFINDNFLHPPSIDLSKESIKALVELNLAQAQECFIEKVLAENKKGNMVSKLSAHVSLIYNSVVDDMTSELLSSQFEKSWIDLLKVKAKYFDALSHQHKAIYLESDQKYGEAVAHLNQAEDLSKDSVKQATVFAKKYPTFTVSSISSSSSTKGQQTTIAAALKEMTTLLYQQSFDMKKSLTKENELIYHEPVPLITSPLEKLIVVKHLSFQDICGSREEVQRIIGKDIFMKLVPMSVHESASLYSEELIKMLRATQAECENADNLFDATMLSLNPVKVLDQLKRTDKDLDIPKDVLDLCDDIRVCEQASSGNSLIDYNKIVIGLKASVEKGLESCKLSLDKEQFESESMSVKYGSMWTLDPSFSLTVQYRQDIKKYEDTLSSASKTDTYRQASLNELNKNIQVLLQSSDQLEGVILSLGNTSETSLIDVSEESNVGEELLVSKMNALLAKLRDTKAERRLLVEKLRDNVHEDEITQSLVLNKGRETLVFRTEIAKFKPAQEEIYATIKNQTQMFQELSTFQEKLLQVSSKLKFNKSRDEMRRALYQKWRGIYDSYKKGKSDLIQGIQFYTDLQEMIETTLRHVESFVQNRSTLRNNMIRSIEGNKASLEQNAMKEQLARLSLSQPQSAIVPMFHHSQTIDQNNLSLSSQYNYPRSSQYSQPAPLPPIINQVPQCFSPQNASSVYHHFSQPTSTSISHAHQYSSMIQNQSNQYGQPPVQQQYPPVQTQFQQQYQSMPYQQPYQSFASQTSSPQSLSNQPIVPHIAHYGQQQGQNETQYGVYQNSSTLKQPFYAQVSPGQPQNIQGQQLPPTGKETPYRLPNPNLMD